MQGSTVLRARPRLREEPLLATVAAAAALLVLGALIVRWGDIRAAMLSNADLAAPLALGEQAHRYDDAFVMTGNYGWWPGLWASQALRSFPTVASSAPAALSVVLIGLLAWQARRVWNRVSALIVVIVAASVGGAAWVFLFGWSGRAPTWWAMIVLATATTWLLDPSSHRRGLQYLAAGAGVLAAAIVLSGDKLALAATVAPLVAVAALMAWRRDRTAALMTTGMATAVVVGSVVVRELAHAAGYLQQSYPVETASFTELGTLAANTLSGTLALWRGDRVAALDYGAGYAGALLTIVVAAAAASWLRKSIAQTRDDAAPRRVDTEARTREVWMTYWLAALLAMIAVFTLSLNAIDGGSPVTRYLFGAPFAVAALAAGAAAASEASRRWVLGLAVVTASLGSLAALRTPPPVIQAGRVDIADRVLETAQQHGITRGYAPYWSAYPIQVAVENELDMVPVGGCPGIEPPRLCPMYLHYVDQAYLPRAGRGSFVLIDPTGATPGSPTPPPGSNSEWITQLPPGLSPTQTVDVGDGVTMAIFDTDVASQLHPPVRPGPAAGAGGPRVVGP